MSFYVISMYVPNSITMVMNITGKPVLTKKMGKAHTFRHRGLKLDGAIGQEKFVTPSKVKNFQNPSLPILEKIKNNFLAVMKH